MFLCEIYLNLEAIDKGIKKIITIPMQPYKGLTINLKGTTLGDGTQIMVSSCECGEDRNVIQVIGSPGVGFPDSKPEQQRLYKLLTQNGWAE